MRPPAMLCAFRVFATCSRRRAEAIRRGPTPLTRTRRKARLVGLASTSSRVVAPKRVAGLAALTNESASTTATALAGHGTGSPAHLPPTQASRIVQASPSAQVVPSGAGGFEQVAVAGLQVPAPWHWSSAVQTTGVPAQTPAWQVSPVVQALPSLQLVPLATA